MAVEDVAAWQHRQLLLCAEFVNAHRARLGLHARELLGCQLELEQRAVSAARDRRVRFRLVLELIRAQRALVRLHVAPQPVLAEEPAPVLRARARLHAVPVRVRDEPRRARERTYAADDHQADDERRCDPMRRVEANDRATLRVRVEEGQLEGHARLGLERSGHGLIVVSRPCPHAHPLDLLDGSIPPTVEGHHRQHRPRALRIVRAREVDVERDARRGVRRARALGRHHPRVVARAARVTLELDRSRRGCRDDRDDARRLPVHRVRRDAAARARVCAVASVAGRGRPTRREERHSREDSSR
mmetsp:Transcript_9639/g.30504  ORF Transcript_9639/g.30504 Transcript_9639/m.30504 type:complete len:302 (+) Transcript_9639:719-1624(+)